VRWVYFIERYRTVTNVAGTVLVSWILSALVMQIVALLLPPAPSPVPAAAPASVLDEGILLSMNARRLDHYQPICERNLFDSLKRAQCSAEAPEGSEGGGILDLNSEPIKSDIGATLLGTMVSTNPNFSFATVQVKGSSDSETYRIEQMLLGEAKIYDIQRNTIYFIRNGHREYLEVENLPSIYVASPGGAPVPMQPGGVRLEGDKAIVARARVDATLGDLNQVVQQARMVPNFKDGAVDGFKVFAIQPNSIFQQLGLQNGDVIQRINGNEINSVEKAIPMLQLARNESTVTIDLIRGGAKKTLTIEIR
jgi:general secretion pathway protein C